MNPDFTKNELIPAIVQDVFTKNILMLGYMNKEALDETIKLGKVTFYSRSKQRLWTKGETSGNFLMVKELALDCDRDTILVQAAPTGPSCHNGTDTCFGSYKNKGYDLSFLSNIIQDRKDNPKEGSYTNILLNNIDKAAQKVGEEAVELVIEAKDQRPERFVEEAADLMYHYMVLLSTKGHDLEEVISILRERMK